MKKIGLVFPWIIVSLAVLTFFMALITPKDKPGEMNLNEFGRLPVVYQGRTKPFDTLARNSLTIISEKQSYKDAFGKTQPAIKWLLDTISNAPASLEHKVFRIENHELLTLLDLKARSGYRYAINEFKPKIADGTLDREFNRVRNSDDADQDAYEKNLKEFVERFQRYRVLSQSHRFPRSLEEFRQITSFNPPRTIPPQIQSRRMETFYPGRGGKQLGGKA